MRSEFPMVPASTGAFWMLAAIGLLMVGLLALFGWIAWSGRHATLVASPEGIAVERTIYGRRIPADLIDLARARAVDLDRDSDLRPRWRTNGAGLPGYKVGWFRLRSGEKALLFVTDRERVVYVPTTAGYALLASVPDPDAFLRALREAIGGA